ncbi:MAG TPA: aspartate kinase [Pyrinomonadaceae bacterium]|nr:aspartate kinase [Pyrinomonadaceae bacterium]
MRQLTEKIRVMKFGGTSVADAECFRRSAGIIAAGAGGVVAVVSAMCGVTNRLVEAARRSASGDASAASELAATLRAQHLPVIETLAKDPGTRSRLSAELEEILEEVSCLCRAAALLRELTPRALDAVSGAGERLSARMLAGALCELGLRAVAVEATELIVTDDEHGQAEPLLMQTRGLARARLLPLLEDGAIPVVTGFIGATAEGALTTLGRNGSDYSATILGAALGAAEVVIWSDVDGILTADPHLVPEASPMSEISYDEATELSYFGAKVLHPKTLRPVEAARIPVCIRNSFRPEQPGTRITASGSEAAQGVKAVTAIKDVCLVSVGGREIVGGHCEVAARTFAAAAKARAEVLLISQSSSRNDICFIVKAAEVSATVEALREEFAVETTERVAERINVTEGIAVVAVVGEKVRGTTDIAGRAFVALGNRGINIVAVAQGSSDYNVSFVVEASAMSEAVSAVHAEFGLQQPAALPELLQIEGASAGV